MRIQAALVALAASLVSAVPTLEIQGNEFVNPKSGNKFQIVGVAYQPGGSSGFDPKKGDPLSHPDQCLRDAALMQIMGVNAIRVYNLNPDANHDECASIFNEAGIYLIIDVNSPLVAESLDANQPWASYYPAYSNHTFAVVEAFAGYPNTLLFFSGNEVIQKDKTPETVPPYVRAVTRDLKNYIKKNIKRQIPVGYSAADVRDILWDTWNYMTCGDDGKADDMSRGDLFALNSYSWCAINATFESSQYDQLTNNFTSSSVPVFFSEYGCNEPKPRYWNETRALYSDKMTPTFVGGVVYEYTEEANGFGLVSVNGSDLNIMGDFNRLKEAWATIDWESVQSEKAEKKKVTVPECSSKLIKEKNFNNNFTLPAVLDDVQDMIDNGIKPKPSGKTVKISNYDVKLTVKDSEGKEIKGLKVVPLKSDEFNWLGKNKAETGSSDPDKNSDQGGNSTGSGGDDKKKDDEDSGAMLMRPLTWAAVVPLLAMMFA